jgi:hypothetical protein
MLLLARASNSLNLLFLEYRILYSNYGAMTGYKTSAMDPDPGGQKRPINIEKLINYIFRSAGYSLLRA